MVAINGASRAKRSYLQVEKTDSSGRKYIGQNELVISHGMFSAREAERELQKAADSSDERVVGWNVETYSNRENPEIAGNPRRGDASGEVFGGWYSNPAWPPESPMIQAIEARRKKRKSESG